MTTSPTTTPIHQGHTTMRAVVQDRYGPPETLEVRSVEMPQIGDLEVLVAVASAGIDHGAWHLMTGLPYPTRLAFGLRRPKTPIPGLDLAGVVRDVGPAVTRFAAGDRVFGHGTGTYAEFAVAPETKLAAIPRGMDVVDAGALAVTGSTALQAVDVHARVRPGDEVLVLGASGGVGHVVVQIAKARNAVVTGVARGAKHDLVRSLGADRVIDYTVTDPLGEGRQYDIIIDTGGNRSLRALRRALSPSGSLVIVGGEGGGRLLGGLDRQLRARITSAVVSQRLTTFIAAEDADHLERLADLVDRGLVTPMVDRTFPLDHVADAFAHLRSGRARGKVVLVPNAHET
ncbi:NAD(P)-dependent alcohol dehydrogenase [Euzebya tangerina]|uniref:NAD(P)-dependent alcohol dehydrogenase n=1 Tax=Euzebya tangerina TaxID=591198 RepID=UPI00196A3CCE|nr:NAD(P)-dependent alcohol dehydrogenase [Euzebya tangerina]